MGYRELLNRRDLTDERIAVEGELRIQSAQGDFEAELTELSLAGARASGLAEQLPSGSRVRLRIIAGDIVTDAFAATVAWQEDDRAGFRFHNDQEEGTQRELIEALIESLQAKEEA